MKNDERIRELVHSDFDKGLTHVDYIPSIRYEIMKKARGEVKVKKKLSVAMVCALIMIFIIGGAVAIGLGIFGQFSTKEINQWASGKLAHLDENANAVGNTVHVDAIGNSFDFTLNQAYTDGTKLYYSYTLKAAHANSEFGVVVPEDIAWDLVVTGRTVEEAEISNANDRINDMWADWFGKNPIGFVKNETFHVGDGASVDGKPTMILDSDEEYVDDTTILGYQEVELPEGIDVKERLSFDIPVGYGAMVCAQDEAGSYFGSLSYEDGHFTIPFTISVDKNVTVKAGHARFETWSAEAELIISANEMYGKVILEGPEYWAEEFASEGIEDTSYPMSFILVADGVEYQSLEGGFGPIVNGKYEVPIRYDLIEGYENLSLRAENGATDGSEDIVLK